MGNLGKNPVRLGRGKKKISWKNISFLNREKRLRLQCCQVFKTVFKDKHVFMCFNWDVCSPGWECRLAADRTEFEVAERRVNMARLNLAGLCLWLQLQLEYPRKYDIQEKARKEWGFVVQRRGDWWGGITPNEKRDVDILFSKSVMDKRWKNDWNKARQI